MNKKFNENVRIKIPAILHLTRLDYNYVSLKQVEQQLDGETNYLSIRATAEYEANKKFAGRRHHEDSKALLALSTAIRHAQNKKYSRQRN